MNRKLIKIFLCFSLVIISWDIYWMLVFQSNGNRNFIDKFLDSKRNDSVNLKGSKRELIEKDFSSDFSVNKKHQVNFFKRSVQMSNQTTLYGNYPVMANSTQKISDDSQTQNSGLSIVNVIIIVVVCLVVFCYFICILKYFLKYKIEMIKQDKEKDLTELKIEKNKYPIKLPGRIPKLSKNNETINLFDTQYLNTNAFEPSYVRKIRDRSNYFDIPTPPNIRKYRNFNSTTRSKSAFQVGKSKVNF